MAAPVMDRFIAGSAVTSTAGSAVTATATFAETPAVGTDHVLVAIVRRRGNTANDPVGLTPPAGWTVLGTQTATNATITVGLTVLWRRGDGTTNSISVDGTTGATGTGLTTQVLLASFTTPRTAAPFIEGFVGVGANGVATQSVTLAAASGPSSVPVVASALSGTAGGTGIAFNAGTLLKSTGSADSFNGIVDTAVAPAAGSTRTATWTSSTIAATAAFWVVGLNPTIDGAATITDTMTVDLTTITPNTGGTLTHTASPSSGVTIAAGVATITRQAAARVVTITTTDSGGAPPRTTTVTVQPPQPTTGLERRRKTAGGL